MDLDQETYNLIRDTSRDVKHIRELMEASQRDIEDHEIRIRDLETGQLVAIGTYQGVVKVAAIIATSISLGVAVLQFLLAFWRGG